ncbi:hypothetical protein TrLO_g11050 [Triparma laevis f. longispina]|uniref:EGF-like domain-containing protein n=1 Tax=Triparma laevis f. longispina TaxID=1714387 RepID=A0A9W7CC78_9STRA|nr:hypothetical protein TrLO_g11050 [Triparma laevis f. longispina]
MCNHALVAGQDAGPDPALTVDANKFEKEMLGFRYSPEDGSFIDRPLTKEPHDASNGGAFGVYEGFPALISMNDITSSPLEDNYLRSANPDGSGAGTRNWEKMTHGSQSFTRRNGHASSVFTCPEIANLAKGAQCLWLVGGRSEEYQAFDLEFTRRNADVYYSSTGNEWWQVDILKGDYTDGIGNFDASFPGKRPVAPWYSRFGHSLDAIDMGHRSLSEEGEKDAMVLLGGYNPEPSNDVWITTDGVTWAFDGYAPFTERGWHSTAIFRGEMYVVGGAPLTNDIWVGNLTVKDDSMYNITHHTAYDLTMVWKQKVKYMDADIPFSPRSGHCLLTQLRRNNYNSTDDLSKTDRMFLIGGFASWPSDDNKYDGERSRNDVYVTEDGKNWTKMLAPCTDETCQQRKMSMDWAARSWHGCATFHSPNDRSVDINEAAQFEYEVDNGNGDEIMHPKMYIMGGGYIGTKRNHVIRKMEAYVDTWWSRDGINWQQVNLKDSADAALYTTQEWAETAVEGVDINIGKWGFTLETFIRSEDMNGDGVISTEPISFDVAGNMPRKAEAVGAEAGVVAPVNTNARFWRSIKNKTESKVPSLFFIAGDTVDAGGLVNDVFVSKPGLLCEKNGISCNNQGICGPGTLGCICSSRQWLGEYCERLNENYYAAAWGLGVGRVNGVVVLGAMVWFIL